MAKLRTRLGGRTVTLDRRDVAAWAGWREDLGDEDMWQRLAAEYVEAHPRPGAHGLGGTGIASAQRMAILRRLASGPAARTDLLAAMRRVGWVGADDLENRLRDLRAADQRAGEARLGLNVLGDGERYRLAEAFPTLDDASERALTFARAVLRRLDTPLAVRAVATLDGLVPGLSDEAPVRLAPGLRATAAVLERFDEALHDRRAARVRYFSMNSGRERTYELAPVEYVTVGPVVKAICVPVDSDGRRSGNDSQFALDRLLDVTPLPDWRRPRRSALTLQRSPITLEVSDGLFQVMRQRSLFGIRAETSDEVDIDVWRVAGTFPTALAWDVMEQLCAWAGNVQVHEPLWLVNAVCRRLRAGLEVMETGQEFRLVKPEPGRHFASLGDAVSDDERVAGEVELARPGLAARRLRPV